MSNFYYMSKSLQSSQQHESSTLQRKGKFRSKSKKKKLSCDKIEPSNLSNSSQFDQKKCLQENKPLLNYFNEKQCEICHTSQNQRTMYLCDKCEDGYHLQCLQMEEESLTETWICPSCIKQEKQAESIVKDIQLEIPDNQRSECAKCKKNLGTQTFDQVYFGDDFEKIQVGFQDELQTKICLYCKKNFHFTCFNIRTNALNCSKCEQMIRVSCPKGHKKFLEYYRSKYEVFKKQKYMRLTPLPLYMRQPSNKRYPKLSFKLPTPVTNWQLITQYEASIYYAFETKKLNFIQDQIYDDQITMKLNRWDGEGERRAILGLHEDDEKLFEVFKRNTTDGVIVGPYEIKEDRAKGFHIAATDFIPKMTIITEYVGEVVPSRRSLFHHNQNDSVFILIKNSRSCLSLDIVPHQFGNISRFFSGINNQCKQSRKRLNVQVRRFSYKGRVRILFYALKDIQAGDQLFFDYNGGPFHEYPTQNFKI